MTSRGLAEVLLKLFGVYWLVHAIVSLPALATYRSMVSSAGWAVVVIPGLTVVLYLVLGTWFLAHGRRLSARIAAEEPEGRESVTPQSAQAIAFSVLGLYLASAGVASLASNATSFKLLEGHETEWVKDEFFNREWPSIASSAVYLLAGLGLFFGSSSLAGFWHRLRPLAR